MRKGVINALIVLLGMTSLSSCIKDFLKGPIGTAPNIDTVFSSSQKAEAAIAQAYSESLCSGITVSGWDNNRTYGLRGGTLDELSGEANDTKFNWEDGWIIQHSGMTSNDGSGLPLSDDGFNFNYTAIRLDYLIAENINKVPDMNTVQKQQVEGEMLALIAYRYLSMFKRYGGVPIVTKSLSVQDTLKIPRATLQQTLNFIVSLCDSAADMLPNSYPPQWGGRITKGAAMAMKAEALMFAARPLFNEPTPPLSLGANNDLICLGNYDPTRWQTAADAAKAVIDWAQENGCYIINTGHPLDDYGNAVATPSNPEVLLAYRNESDNASGSSYYDPHGQSGGANSMSFYQLQQYYKADGSDQTWPTDGNWHPYAEYAQKIQEMGARYKESAMGAGIDAWNNPNDTYWSSEVLSNSSNWDGRGGTEACGRRVKFWYHAGTRYWFEFPLFRLAEFYLECAEAYNELGNPALVLQYLNVIHERAGLPPVTETDQTKLRKVIQREWAVEFYMENKRLYDVKAWKLPDIGNGIIGGPKESLIYQYQNGQYGMVPSDYISYQVGLVYTGFWAPNQYFTPFPATEVAKGYLVQNPGY